MGIISHFPLPLPSFLFQWQRSLGIPSPRTTADLFGAYLIANSSDESESRYSLYDIKVWETESPWFLYSCDAKNVRRSPPSLLYLIFGDPQVRIWMRVCQEIFLYSIPSLCLLRKYFLDTLPELMFSCSREKLSCVCAFFLLVYSQSSMESAGTVSAENLGVLMDAWPDKLLLNYPPWYWDGRLWRGCCLLSWLCLGGT